MKSNTKTSVSSLGQAVLALLLICNSHTILRAEGATYQRFIWSGGRPGFSGVLLLDSAYCRYDSASGLCDLIGPGSYITTPGGGRYDLWQLQRDQKLQVRATFTSTALRQLYITETSSASNGLSGSFTLTQNYTNGALAPTAILDEHSTGSSGVGPRGRDLDASGLWIPAPQFEARKQVEKVTSRPGVTR